MLARVAAQALAPTRRTVASLAGLDFVPETHPQVVDVRGTSLVRIFQHSNWHTTIDCSKLACVEYKGFGWLLNHIQLTFQGGVSKTINMDDDAQRDAAVALIVRKMAGE